MKDTHLVEEGLKPIEGYLLSIKRDPMQGWYYFEIGLPAGWIFKANEVVECETINETKKGTLIKIAPKVEGVTVDDLISFVSLIIETNSKIAEKEKEFTDKMDQVKVQLEEQAKQFYSDLDNLRQKSFEEFGTEITKPIPPPSQSIKEGQEPKPIKRGRGRPPGSKNKKKTADVRQETE